MEGHSPVRIEHPVACLAVMAYVYAAAYVACLPLISARGPSGLMVRASDYYSEGLGFKSQLDPGFFRGFISHSLNIKHHS